MAIIYQFFVNVKTKIDTSNIQFYYLPRTKTTTEHNNFDSMFIFEVMCTDTIFNIFFLLCKE